MASYGPESDEDSEEVRPDPSSLRASRRAAKKEGSSGGTMLSRLLTKYDMRNSFEGIAEDGEQMGSFAL